MQVCEQVIRIQVIGIWKVSCAQGIYVFEGVSWKQTLPYYVMTEKSNNHALYLHNVINI